MTALPFVLLALGPGGLSHDDYRTREWADLGMRIWASPADVRKAWIDSDDPEARERLRVIRKFVTIRELDRLAGPAYPRADAIDGWTRDPRSYPYTTPDPPEFWWPELQPEQYPDYCPHPGIPDEAMREHTKWQLQGYVLRTNDWAKAKKILETHRAPDH